MSLAVDLSHYAKPERDGTLALDLAVDGITCGACIGRIESAVKLLPGVTEARLNYTNRRLHVAWNEGALTPARILDALGPNGILINIARSRPTSRACKTFHGTGRCSSLKSGSTADETVRRRRRARSRAAWRSPALPA